MGEPGDEARYIESSVAELPPVDTERDVMSAKSDANAYRGMVIQRLDRQNELLELNARATALLVKELRSAGVIPPTKSAESPSTES